MGPIGEGTSKSPQVRSFRRAAGVASFCLLRLQCTTAGGVGWGGGLKVYSRGAVQGKSPVIAFEPRTPCLRS